MVPGAALGGPPEEPEQGRTTYANTPLEPTPRSNDRDARPRLGGIIGQRKMNTCREDLYYIALQSIENAIRDLSRPTGRGTATGPSGVTTELTTYSTQTEQDRLLVTEDLIGSAFVLAQTYLRQSQTRPPKAEAIEAVANYWKHRNEWDLSGTPKGNQRATIEAIRKWVAELSLTPGELIVLTEKALGQRFSVDALWSAMTCKPTVL